MSILKNKIHTRLMQQQDGEGGDAGGTDAIAPEVQELIAKAVSEATAGLKANNAALLHEKKSLQQNLQKFDGIDVEAVSAIVKQFADTEEAGLIKAGRIDEVLAKRTERMSADFGKKIKAESDRADAAEKLSASLRERALADAIRGAATKAGALPEASDDFVLRSRGLFQFDENGDVVAVDRAGNVVYGKDGQTSLTPLEWTETLRETAPHLWPKPTGAGTPGNYGGKATKPFKDMTEAEKVALYRDNPAKFTQLAEASNTLKKA